MKATVMPVSPEDDVVMTGPIPCRRCHATVTWARTRKGARILMDFRPVDRGEWCIVGIDHPYRIMAKLSETPSKAARYMCHFDTCANPNPYYRKRTEHYQRNRKANAAFKHEWDKRAAA